MFNIVVNNYSMSSMKKQNTNTQDQFFETKQSLVEPKSMEGNDVNKIEEMIAGSMTMSVHFSVNLIVCNININNIRIHKHYK